MAEISNSLTTEETMNFKAYTLVERAVEEGINFGWNRGHKYADDPEPEVIKEAILNEVMLALSEIIDFDESVDTIEPLRADYQTRQE